MPIRVRAICPHEYDYILGLDGELFPIAEPPTPAALRVWYSRNPEFGMMIDDTDSGQVAGVNIIIPLNEQGFVAMMKGEVSEASLSPEHIYDAEHDDTLALHCYHIEKMGPVIGFVHYALSELCRLVVEANQARQGALRVVGWSALCASPSGVNLFQNTLNFRETEARQHKHIMRRKGAAGDWETRLVDSPNEEEVFGYMEQGWEYLLRCRMVGTWPGDVSLVWYFLQKEMKRQGLEEGAK